MVDTEVSLLKDISGKDDDKFVLENIKYFGKELHDVTMRVSFCTHPW
jgi:hypothetical protein